MLPEMSEPSTGNTVPEISGGFTKAVNLDQRVGLSQEEKRKERICAERIAGQRRGGHM